MKCLSSYKSFYQVLSCQEQLYSNDFCSYTVEHVNKNIPLLILKYLLTRQYDGESIHDFYNRYKNNCEALSVIAGDHVTCFEKVMKITWEDLYINLLDEQDRELVVTLVRERFAAMCFILGANERQFSHLKRTLKTNNNMSVDNYPTSMQASYELLLKE